MKTPYIPTPKLLADDPFNRLRWALNEIQGKFDAASRNLIQISQCTDLNVARKLATETLQIMSEAKQNERGS